MCNPPGELTQVDPHMQYKQLHKEMKIYNRKEKQIFVWYAGKQPGKFQTAELLAILPPSDIAHRKSAVEV